MLINKKENCILVPQNNIYIKFENMQNNTIYWYIHVMIESNAWKSETQNSQKCSSGEGESEVRRLQLHQKCFNVFSNLR